MAGIGSSLSASNATDIKISNLDLPLANTEYPFALNASCKGFEINARGKSTLKIAFVEDDTSVKYKTVFRGTAWEKQGFSFVSKILYIQANIADEVVEIVELF